MESRYGIGINNRYAMFLDEDGEGEELYLPKKKAVTEDAKVAKVEVKPAPPIKKVDDKNIKSQSPTKPNNREGKNSLKLIWKVIGKSLIFLNYRIVIHKLVNDGPDFLCKVLVLHLWKNNETDNFTCEYWFLNGFHLKFATHVVWFFVSSRVDSNKISSIWNLSLGMNNLIFLDKN